MATATYDTIIKEVQQLTVEEQTRLRDDIETMLSNHSSSVRPGLENDLAELDKLAEDIGNAWQSDRSAVEAVDHMRR